MATTFQRLKKITEIGVQQKEWDSKESLVQVVQERKPQEFQIHSNENGDHECLRSKSIRRLIRLASDLELMEPIDKTNKLRVTEKGREALQSEYQYKKVIKSSVKNYLEAKHMPINEILDAMEKIKLPNLPDITTVYNNLPDNKLITERELREFMFLYAQAEGIERRMKVVYLEK